MVAATARHFLELDRMALQEKQHQIDRILSTSSSVEETQQRLSKAFEPDHGFFVSIKTLDGKIIFQSKDFEPAPLSLAQKTREQEALNDWKDNGRDLRGMSSLRAPAYDSASKLDILVAVETAHHTQFIGRLHRTLALYALLAIAISGLLSWLAAYRGLAPLRTMKAKATAVSGQQLHERMPVETVPIEMANLAQELNHMLERLQEDFQKLSEFSSNLAHELRTPISNLLTQTQVALSTKRDADTYREILASNAEELQRLARTISDMLFLAKTECAADLPSKEPFSVANEAKALLEFYEAVAEAKNIKLSLHGEGKITGDRLMFRRAVSNLLSNALHHSKEHAEVKIEIHETALNTVITVENAGEDIDPKILPRLFDRFYRADPSRSHPESDGAGLGLSITRAIAKAHGGSVSATSSRGKTRFILDFPH